MSEPNYLKLHGEGYIPRSSADLTKAIANHLTNVVDVVVTIQQGMGHLRLRVVQNNGTFKYFNIKVSEER